MMLMTSTGQVSLDWEGEEDCVRKTVTTARLTPLLVALYANSPLVEGPDTGLVSFRSKVWTEVDPARCGYLPQLVRRLLLLPRLRGLGAGCAAALPAPPRRVPLPQAHLPPAAAAGLEGQPADMADWTDHLSTLFPEVRLKKVMEVRGADCVGAELTGALPALWRGLLYEPSALAEAEALLPLSATRSTWSFHATARTQGCAATCAASPCSGSRASWWASRSAGWSGWMRRMRPCSRRSPRWRAAAARRPRRCARRGRRIRAPSRSTPASPSSLAAEQLLDAGEQAALALRLLGRLLAQGRARHQLGARPSPGSRASRVTG